MSFVQLLIPWVTLALAAPPRAGSGVPPSPSKPDAAGLGQAMTVCPDTTQISVPLEIWEIDQRFEEVVHATMASDRPDLQQAALTSLDMLTPLIWVASAVYGVPYELMACLLFKESKFGSETKGVDVAQFTPGGRAVVTNLLSDPASFSYFDPSAGKMVSYRQGWDGYWLYLTSDYPSATRLTPAQTGSDEAYAVIAMAAHLRYGYDKARKDLGQGTSNSPNPIVDMAWYASAGIYNLGEEKVLGALRSGQSASTFISAVPDSDTRDYLTKARACVKKIAPDQSFE